MNSIELKAPAKINLSLDVIRKRPDGYHEVKMIMQSIELHDIIYMEKSREGIDLACNLPYLPLGADNIAFKAADLLMKDFNIQGGIRIEIDKRIPVAAGLAGGSTDAAAVLKGMNRLYSLGLTDEELMDLGKKLGADVPFCIRGGTMLAEGIGEVLNQLDSLAGVNIVLVKPKISVSTAWVYKNLNLDKIQFRPDTDLLIKAINNRNIEILAKNMRNVLETVTTEKYAIINQIKNELIKHGAAGSMMSGSGPTVFGIFLDRHKAENAYKALKCNAWDCFLTETVC